MCGRTCLLLNEDQVRCACSYKPKGAETYVKPDWLPEHNADKEYVPSYNIAPMDVTPVLVSSSKFKNVALNDRVLKPMMWGVIPPWHKEDYKTHNLSTNNCRLENIKGSKLYNPLLKNGGRCVIVVEGFYEWQTTDKSSKAKQPYYIYAPQSEAIKTDDPTTWNNSYNEKTGWSGIKLLSMAGLYNVWQKENTVIYSYTVITMDSNSTLKWLHHRMPAILDTEEQIQHNDRYFCPRLASSIAQWKDLEENFAKAGQIAVNVGSSTEHYAWLDIDNVNPDMALSYLRQVKVLSWHPVSTVVNNSRNKSDDCNKRVIIEKKTNLQKPITTWFTKQEKQSDVKNPDAKRMKK